MAATGALDSVPPGRTQRASVAWVAADAGLDYRPSPMVVLSEFPSPLGPISVAECQGRLLAVTFGNVDQLVSGNPGLARWECQRRGSLGAAGSELRRFLHQDTGSLRVKVDLSLVTGEFDQAVLRELYRTRPGTTLTYGALAERVKHPRAARAVGGAMRRNPIPIAIPCHRVLPTTGGLGNYTGGVDKKAWLLAREGISPPHGERLAHAS